MVLGQRAASHGRLVSPLLLRQPQLKTRAVTLDRHISCFEEIHAAALKLLSSEWPGELRLMGLRMSSFWEAQKREAGQPSLEQLLQRRQHAQQQQQQHESTPGTSSAPETQEREEAPSSSQVLSQAELVELSFRDWGGKNDVLGAAATAADDAPSLPPSLAISPAAAARYERQASEAVAAASDHTAELLRGAAERLQQTWACPACTFENSRMHARCQMCGGASVSRGSAAQQPAAAEAAEAEPSARKGPTAEQITAIKAAIAAASTLEEVRRLEEALKTGHLPSEVAVGEGPNGAAAMDEG